MMSPQAPRLSLILPCYNEMEHIAVSLAKISGYLDFVFGSDFEIILVDDGSTDGTRTFLEGLRSEPSRFKVELNPRNLGRGGAVKRGLELARGRVTGFMDIDCEVSEVYLPRFVQQVESGADLVLGSRVYKVTPRPWVLVRHFASVGYRKLLGMMLDSAEADSEVGYKFFSQRGRELILARSRFDNWFWDTEVVELCARAGLKLAHVPVLFLRNTAKTSTVRVLRDALLYVRSIREFKALLRSGAYERPAQVAHDHGEKKRA